MKEITQKDIDAAVDYLTKAKGPAPITLMTEETFDSLNKEEE